MRMSATSYSAIINVGSCSRAKKGLQKDCIRGSNEPWKAQHDEWTINCLLQFVWAFGVQFRIGSKQCWSVLKLLMNVMSSSWTLLNADSVRIQFGRNTIIKFVWCDVTCCEGIGLTSSTLAVECDINAKNGEIYIVGRWTCLFRLAMECH